MSAVQTQLLNYRFKADSAELRGMRDQVRKQLAHLGCGDEYSNAVVLALDEACSNIIRHAYADEEGDVIVEICRQESSLVFRVIDFAAPCDKASIKSRDLDDVRPGGLGVHLIATIMDEVMHEDAKTGNILRMTKQWPEGDR